MASHTTWRDCQRCGKLRNASRRTCVDCKARASLCCVDCGACFSNCQRLPSKPQSSISASNNLPTKTEVEMPSKMTISEYNSLPAKIETELRELLSRFSPSSKLSDWIKSSVIQPSNPLSIDHYDTPLRKDFLDWLSSIHRIDRSIDVEMNLENERLEQYKQASSIIECGVTLTSLKERSPEDIFAHLQIHLDAIISFEKHSQQTSTLASFPSPKTLQERVERVFVTLRHLCEKSSLRCGQLQDVKIDVLASHIGEMLEGEPESDINAGFALIERGIKRRIAKLNVNLEQIALQMDILRELAELISQLYDFIQQRLTGLNELIIDRSRQQQDILQALRSSVSNIVNCLNQVYLGQINFFSEECQYLSPKFNNARSLGLKDIANKYQKQITKMESQITSVDAKLKQLSVLQKQFGASVHQLSLPPSTSTNAATTVDQDVLLLRVKEKERLLMVEAVHTVEQVVEYEAMMEGIRRQNEDLKVRLREHQQELLEVLLCPITQEVMVDPVLAADNHTYERQAIELWLRNHSRSPLTNQELPHKNLEPNWCVKNILAKMRELYQPHQ